ncbi:MAG: hypothetical protein ACJAW7_002408 [Candidatus Azotimanducaceae bacterium]|jgi:hypothetical protein
MPVDEPEDLRNLYYEFGRTAEMAQVMETEAGNYALTYASLVFHPATITDEERIFFKNLMEDIDRRTFGNLMKQIKKTANVDDSILNTVDHALERRNYLTHEFYRHHNS